MKGKLLPILITLVSVILAGYFLFQRLQPREVMAKVNGAPVTKSQIDEVLQKFMPAGGWEEVDQKGIQTLDKQVLALLIDQELLLQEVEKHKIELLQDGIAGQQNGAYVSNSDGDDSQINITQWRQQAKNRARVNQLIDQEVNAKLRITEAEVREYYKRNKENFSSHLMVKVQQIFLRERPQAELIRKQLSEGQNFGELARKWSQSPEAEKGGNMGYLRKGELPEEMEKYIFAIKPGQISPVVKSSYGFHIFKVTKAVRSGKDDFGVVQKEIENQLLRELRHKAFESWLQKIRSKARIIIY